MEAYEATRVVFTRIQGLDPENAAKIMGLLLIQDNGEKEMIRLAFGPETIVQATVWKARKELGLLGSPTSTTSTGAAASLSGAAPYFSRQNSRLLSSTSSSPSPSSSSSSAAASPSGWANAGHHPHNAFFRGGMSCNGGDGDEAAARNTTDEIINVNDPAAAPVLSSSGTAGNHATLSESHSPGGHQDRSISNGYLYGGETIDVLPFPSYHFSFLNDQPLSSSSSQSLASANATNRSPGAVSPGYDYGAAAAAGLLYDDRKINNGGNNDALLFPYVNWASSAASNNNATASSAALGAGHRRSCSLADLCLTPAEAGLAWKPCMYYARGYCKNGSNCRFLHGFLDSYNVGMSPPACGSPTASASNNRAEMPAGDQTTVAAKVTEAEHRASEFLRFKSQRSPSLPHIIPPSFAYGKCGTHPFLFDGYHLPADSPRQLQQNSLFGGDQDTFCRTPGRMDRNDFVNPGSRQIYLTFPAESTFLEEDVSNYFSIYGPVQDVRIPYQQKRMFGFVTFVFPETVKIILAKGNPHYVCDARVLVKPYKEKGKVAEKKHAERGDFSGCSSPNSFDSRETYEVQLGSAGRIFYNSQEAFKRKLEAEQAELHQAIELESRRLMNLHLLDVKKSSLMTNRSLCNQNIVSTPSSDGLRDATESVSLDHSATTTPSERQQQWIGCEILKVVTDAADGRGICDDEENTLQGSLEHNLPDSPFASSIDSLSMISDGIIPGHGFSNNLTSSSSSSLLPATRTLDLTSARSCYFQMPRFSSAHGAIGM